MILVKFGIPFSVMEGIAELECNLIKIHGSRGLVSIANFYNPCQPLVHKRLQEAFGRGDGVIIVCGDFKS